MKPARSHPPAMQRRTSRRTASRSGSHRARDVGVAQQDQFPRVLSLGLGQRHRPRAPARGPLRTPLRPPLAAGWRCPRRCARSPARATRRRSGGDRAARTRATSWAKQRAAAVRRIVAHHDCFGAQRGRLGEDGQAPLRARGQQGVNEGRIGDGPLAEAFQPHRHVRGHERADVRAEEEAVLRVARPGPPAPVVHRRTAAAYEGGGL